MPAMQCPPVCWFLLDGSCPHKSYWNAISWQLLHLLHDIPPYVHVGILLAATVPSSSTLEATTTISYVDLTSPTPHVLQFVQYAAEEDESNNMSSSYNNNPSAAGGGGGGFNGLLDKMALVPANSLYLPNLHAAIRSLVDYDPAQYYIMANHAEHQHAYQMSMPLGICIERVLDFMDEAHHPGEPNAVLGNSTKSSSNNISGSSTGSIEDQVWYAGGKIMTFLASCPTELRGDDWRPLTQKSLPHTTVGLGGFGGRVQITAVTSTTTPTPSVSVATSSSVDEETGGFAVVGNGNGTTTQEILDTDMTPSSLLDYYRAPEHVEAYFSELGAQCAEAAFGVDIFVLVQPKDEFQNDTTEVDVGLPFLRGLADRSGAPGPLIFPLHQGYDTPIASNPNMQRFRREVMARVPWGASTSTSDNGATGTSTNIISKPQGMAFGGELRLRLPPSYKVDTTPVDEVDKGPQLAPLYSSGGIMGPATEEDSSGNLWRLGTCDPFTSVTVDLDMKDKTAKDEIGVDGIGKIKWIPVIQTCFAYTTIVRDPENLGEYVTVRHMRIASNRVPLTDSVETLYSSIDPEVIGNVLFHKLTMTLLRDGLSMAQTIGEDWLKSLLVCVYHSAEIEENRQRNQAEHGLSEQCQSNENGHTRLTFYANERLLDREGELSAEDVLLAQGHELLKALPLIVYSLLQCDAIRPSSLSEGFCPSMDARCAAGGQMSSMLPRALASCIGPRLQLWSCSEGLILDMIDLQMLAIQIAVEEFGNDPRTGKTRTDLVLFLDAPDCIVVCTAQYFSNNQKPPRTRKKKTAIGPDLQKSIDAAVRSHRSAPIVIYDFGEEAGRDGADAIQPKQGYFRILASLIEDRPGKGDTKNYKDWGDILAADVHA